MLLNSPATKKAKVTRRSIRGTRKPRAATIRTRSRVMMEKKVATKSHLTTRLTRTKNTTRAARRRRVESTDTRSTTKKDQRPLAITRRPPRMSTTKNTNSTMTSMKMANIR